MSGKTNRSEDVQVWVNNYTPQVGFDLMAEVMEAGSVRVACQRPNMPNEQTFRRLLLVHEHFRLLYVQMGYVRRMLWAEDVIEIADGEKTSEALGQAADDDKIKVQRDTLRVNARIQLINALSIQRRRGRLGTGDKLIDEEELKVGDRTPAAGQVVVDERPPEDPKAQAYELAKFLEDQRERLGTDSISALVAQLTAQDGNALLPDGDADGQKEADPADS